MSTYLITINKLTKLNKRNTYVIQLLHTMDIVKRLKEEGFPLDYIIGMMALEIQQLHKQLDASQKKIENLKISASRPGYNRDHHIVMPYDRMGNNNERWHDGANRDNSFTNSVYYQDYKDYYF